MRHVTINTARAQLEGLLSSVIHGADTVSIATDDGAAVLVNAEEWKDIQETLYLLSVPGMKESIMEGRATPIGECLDSVGWDIN